MDATTAALQVTSTDLAGLRDRLGAPSGDDSACPRCLSGDACPAWCVEQDDVEALWACDGCDVVGTEADVQAHVDAGLWAADGSLREWADVACHGLMLVGGPAWRGMVFDGVHPADALVIAVQAEAAVLGIDIPGAREG